MSRRVKRIDGLDMIERGAEPAQLMLTDMIMPNMTGSELARLVARRRPEVPVALMSGFSDDPLARSFRRVTAIFIAKPFTPSALCARVRHALAQRWQGLTEPPPALSQT